MTDPRDIPDLVLWHEGMLLAPQHFQQACRRSEELLNYQMRAASPFHWGVRNWELDTVAFADGTFRLISLEAIMSDGLLVLHPCDMSSLNEVEADSLELDLKAAAKNADLDLNAATGIIHLSVIGRSHGTGSDEGLLRFRQLAPAPAIDESVEDSQIEIPHLRPWPFLQLTAEGSSPPARFVSFPLAKVAIREGKFVRERFAEPRLEVTPTSPLYEIAEEVALTMRQQAVALSNSLQQPSLKGSPDQLVQSWGILQALSRTLPHLEANLYSGVSHPFELYLSLCGAYGEFIGLDGQPIPPRLDPYDHNDALGNYTQISDFILPIAKRLREPYMEIRFEQDEVGRFSLDLQPKWLTSRLLIGAYAAPGQAPPVVADWIGKALIGARSRIPSIRDRRFPGARRRPVEGLKEFDLLPPRGVQLFAVEPEPDLVIAGETLEISAPSEIPSEDQMMAGKPAVIVLYVSTESGGTTPTEKVEVVS